MGTDNLSRDMWSRVVYGARVSVTVGFITIALAILLATAVGVSSAYMGGVYDIAVQRVVDAWMSFPYLVIILSIMSVLGPGLFNLILSLSVLVAAQFARVIRGSTLSRHAESRTSSRRGPSAAGTRASSSATSCPTSPRPSSSSPRSGSAA